jgi:hypothetical protein
MLWSIDMCRNRPGNVAQADHLGRCESGALMSEYTPGPWRVIDETDILALEGTPSSIVIAGTKFFEGPSTSWERANARAIACTPELIALCELVLAFHAADTEAFVARYGPGMTTRQLCDRIRAVLAKVADES